VLPDMPIKYPAATTCNGVGIIKFRNSFKDKTLHCSENTAENASSNQTFLCT
jgi:hypothetical protein